MGHSVPDEDPTEFGDDCGFCDADETPLRVRLKTTGLNNCNGCYPFFVHPNWFSNKFSGFDANDGIYVLEQNEFQPCQWLGSFDGAGGVVEKYSGDLCAGVPVEYPIDQVVAVVTLGAADQITISLVATTVGPGGTKTLFTATTVRDSRCANVEDVANEAVCGVAVACSGGLATVEDW